MKTRIRLLKEIYLNEGIHQRELARKLDIGMPSVTNAIKGAKNLLKRKQQGRILRYYLNYSSKNIIPYIYLIEYSRLDELPKNTQYSVYDLLKSLKNKPVLTIIFGSYAKGNYSKSSDLDILLVFNKKVKEPESKAKIISSRYNISISPVYLDFETFSEGFFNQKKKFFQDLKKNKIIISGVEWWVELKNEET
ncbi:hypothetical protein GF336_01745 [Candidatus Woesearchaeota archaeon]|nr:hypothetical protein [Candidatus Woesearchaeota archaeon]